VTEVRDKSPSKLSGILPGDIILTLNGISAQQMDLNVINGFLNSKPGKKIKLEINRQGARLKKEIELRDPI
jgi:C-terminal processing protease CtpA/Prc